MELLVWRKFGVAKSANMIKKVTVFRGILREREELAGRLGGLGRGC